MSDLRDRQLAQLAGPFSRPALVVVDVQRDFADPERIGAYGLTDTALATLDRTVTRIAELVDISASTLAAIRTPRVPSVCQARAVHDLGPKPPSSVPVV